MRTAVIIPAFNEEAAIGRLLRGLVLAPDWDPDTEIVVAANGCTDGTAAVAASFGVRVIELGAASKTTALNAADAIATCFPRIYLDADAHVTPSVIRALAEAVSAPGVLAAAPHPRIDVTHSSWPVRAYYEINSQLPAFRGRLFGRGVVAMSREARERFGQFPEIIADDMLLDAVVSADEKREIDATVLVHAPQRLRDLVRRLARVREGNQQFLQWLREAPRGLVADPIVPSSSSWLRDVVRHSPRLWPASVCYVLVVLLAEARRRRPGWSVSSGWGGQTSTRSGPTRQSTLGEMSTD